MYYHFPEGVCDKTFTAKYEVKHNLHILEVQKLFVRKFGRYSRKYVK